MKHHEISFPTYLQTSRMANARNVDSLANILYKNKPAAALPRTLNDRDKTCRSRLDRPSQAGPNSVNIRKPTRETCQI